MNLPAPVEPDLKRDLRKQFRDYRKSLSADEYARLSQRIASRLLELPVIRKSHLVHIYWPMSEQREIDTRPIIEAMRGNGTVPVLPVVTNFGPANPAESRLKHFAWEGSTRLHPNQWGVCEPQQGRVVPPDELDAIVVPALGAGRNGHRIGHGLGYYDEFLAEASALKIGLIYDRCLIDSVPFEPHDVPLDVIITEEEVLNLPPL